jgi:predicted MPP superfamily phosphohydrolase
MAGYEIAFLLFGLALGALALRDLRRTDRADARLALRRDAAGIVGYGLALLIASMPIGLTLGATGFGLMRLWAWGLFVLCPALLLPLIAWNWRPRRRLALVEAAAWILVVGVGADAFLIEPQWLEVTRYELTSDKLSRDYTVAVLSDIQTDTPGDYEREVLALVREAAPDLILLPGDYVQADGDALQPAKDAFRAIWDEAALDPPLGIYAVGGNVEDIRPWLDLFPPEVTTFEDSRTLLVSDEIAVTGLTLRASFTGQLSVDPDPRFHIVFGHAPDFSMGDVPAELLVAGHTHGGQVRLPLFGPLMTLSRVPRAWAAGRTELSGGRALIVSRGIGMERKQAPRLRFLCRPELIFVQLKAAR